MELGEVDGQGRVLDARPASHAARRRSAPEYARRVFGLTEAAARRRPLGTGRSPAATATGWVGAGGSIFTTQAFDPRVAGLRDPGRRCKPQPHPSAARAARRGPPAPGSRRRPSRTARPSPRPPGSSCRGRTVTRIPSLASASATFGPAEGHLAPPHPSHEEEPRDHGVGGGRARVGRLSRTRRRVRHEPERTAIAHMRTFDSHLRSYARDEHILSFEHIVYNDYIVQHEHDVLLQFL